MEEDKWERTWRWLGGVTSLASSRPEVGFPGTRLIAYLPLARDLECFFPVPCLVLPRGVFGGAEGRSRSRARVLLWLRVRMHRFPGWDSDTNFSVPLAAFLSCGRCVKMTSHCFTKFPIAWCMLFCSHVGNTEKSVEQNNPPLSFS